MMELDAYRIAERFSRLSADQRRSVYQKVRSQGLGMGQFPIPSRHEKGIAVYPASYAQGRQWFLWQLEPESTAYHITGALRLTGELDLDALRSSFESLVKRHESLRTVFQANDEGLACQVILKDSKLDFSYNDVRHVKSESRQSHAHAVLQEASETPFDLTKGPLLRVRVVRLAESEHLMLVVMHHVISDGWSIQLILEEFVTYYRAHAQGRAAKLSELPIQYADYAVWQRHWLEAGERERQLGYWRNQLSDEHPVLKLPTDHPRQVEGKYRAARHEVVLPTALERELRQCAQQQGATFFMVLMTGFQALLYRHTDQQDIRVGIPVANRNRTETEEVVGFFVNTQVIRGLLHGRLPLVNLLGQTVSNVSEAQEYQDLPFEQLVDALQPERSLSHNPLFQVMFNHQHQGADISQRLPGLTLEEYPFGERKAQFELVLSATERLTGSTRLSFTYAAELFDVATIERLASRYVKLLEALVESPEKALDDVVLLADDERRQLKNWETTPRRYSDVEPLPRQIERWATTTPEATAVVCGAEHLSFAEFEARANRLAHWLRRHGIGPDVRVGVGMVRSVDLLVALYGVLKAGGAYVPLDPDYPAERLRYMQADAGIRLLLSHGEVLDHLPLVEGVEAIDLDRQDLTAESATPPPLTIHSQQLAYLIYTSGSTGTPKGVAVAHGALAMHCQSIADRYELTADDRELHFLSISFDGAHERWLSPLSRGARVVLRDQSLWSVQQTYDCLLDEGITVAAFPPSYLRQLAEWAEHQGRPPGVKTYCFAGEAFDRGMLRHAIAALQPDWVINGYGPTETVVTPTLWRAAAEEADFTSAYAPIGDLVGDRQGYVLDGNLNRVPPGMTGELYLGGCLARGYLDRPGTTAERFVPHPFADGERLYRTGDRVRLNVDRHLEYLGRLDQQIKLRGFRIELGEVEAALQSSEEVEEAVAGVCDMVSGQQLVGYVAGARASESDVKAHLSRSLPDYMIPSQVMVLERLPRLPNGKVDRGSLPQPMVSRDDRHEAPEGEAEAVLAMIWSEVLGIEQIGRHDNFFGLGGDSIQSLTLVTRLRQAGWLINTKDVFRYPRLVEMAESLSPCQPVELESEEVDGVVPLTPIQSHFFEQPIHDYSLWNQALLFGLRNEIDIPTLEQVVELLLERHDAIRLGFCKDESGAWRQFYRQRDSVRDLLWERKACKESDLTALYEEAHSSLDIEKGPVIRFLVVSLPDGMQRFLITAHHLIVDGVSWRVLVNDIVRAYRSLEKGREPRLVPVSDSYKRWACMLEKLADHGSLKREEDYWKDVIHQEVLPLSVDFDDAVSTCVDERVCRIRISSDITRRLFGESLSRHGVYINEFLLAALSEAIEKWQGSHRLRIDLEGHGRESLTDDVDVSQTVGWFTSIYPVILPGGSGVIEKLKRARDMMRRIPNNGVGFGILKYMSRHDARERLDDGCPAELVFNYLGKLDGIVNDDWVTKVDDSIGTLVDPVAPRSYKLSVNGQVAGGQLIMACGYSGKQYSPSSIERFLAAFEKAAVELVECTDVATETSNDQPLKYVDPLLSLNDRSEDLPKLFCFHPVSGSVVGYYPIAERLASRWAVYGVQSRQLLEPQWQDISLRQMAHDYADEIIKIQPGGPYHFLGWSLGGTLALEVSKVLESKGKTVEFIGLVDSYVPGAGKEHYNVELDVNIDNEGSDWQRMVAVEKKLHQLAREHEDVSYVTSRIVAWWAKRSPEANAGGERILREKLEGSMDRSIWIDSDHLGIITNDKVIDEIKMELLRAC
ncbi:non-ribosomal peptide synthetase [Halomonas llamarensis]|uniref:Amino acid adenylation domain-containing protein n=1 Tax=Halomonas llamarensis TaxID=2945104 RepID=A0ABT0SU69_9GAMM|nr:non-ribosomal peptide synthetase [Halomonas llamarensis]MCL7931123.1 amino acid adenylation domain-containing protein [Halomonas llamarensis]